MLNPNRTAYWTPVVAGSYTATGRHVMGDEQEIKVASVRLREGVKVTEKNEGGSGSEGFANEETVVARILVPTQYPVSVGDKIVVDNIDLKVALVWPHYTVLGQQDHWECDGVAWPG